MKVQIQIPYILLIIHMYTTIHILFLTTLQYILVLDFTVYKGDQPYLEMPNCPVDGGSKTLTKSTKAHMPVLYSQFPLFTIYDLHYLLFSFLLISY